MIGQAVSLLGAAMILFAYGAQQLGRLERDGPLYQGLNLAGSCILTVVAIRTGSLGLTAMEGAWATISLTALLFLARNRRHAGSGR
jgi:hypothetical protein